MPILVDSSSHTLPCTRIMYYRSEAIAIAAPSIELKRLIVWLAHTLAHTERFGCKRQNLCVFSSDHFDMTQGWL